MLTNQTRWRLLLLITTIVVAQAISWTQCNVRGFGKDWRNGGNRQLMRKVFQDYINTIESAIEQCIAKKTVAILDSAHIAILYFTELLALSLRILTNICLSAFGQKSKNLFSSREKLPTLSVYYHSGKFHLPLLRETDTMHIRNALPL